jgi:WD40 repeat protein
VGERASDKGLKMMTNPLPKMTHFVSSLVINYLGLMTGTAVASGESPAAMLACGSGAVQAVAFSPDGRTLAVGMGRDLAQNGSREALDVQVWDVANWRQQRVLRQQNWDALVDPGAALYPETMSAFAAMAFLPDGRLAICTDKALEVKPHDPHAPNGRYSEVRIWDVKRGTLSQTVTYGGELESLAAPGGQTLLGLTQGLAGLVRWDVRTKATTLVTMPAGDWRRWGTPDVPPEAVVGSVEPLLCTRDGRTVAWWLDLRYRGPEGTEQMGSAYPPMQEFTVLMLWDVPPGRLRRGLAAGPSLSFSPDGSILAALPDPSSATDRNRLDLWDPATGRLTRSLTGLTVPASAVFTPDGRTLAVGGGDGSVTLCPLAEGAPRRVLRAAQPPLPGITSATNAVRSVAVSPDGRLLVAGCGDGTVRVWHLSTSRMGAL